jgi:hypothetical protein
MSKSLIKAAYDESGEIVSTETEDFYSGYDVERMIYGLNPEEATVLFLKYCKYTPLEIVEIMGLKRIKQYYKISSDLRKKTEQTIHKMSKIYAGIHKTNSAKREIAYQHLLKTLKIQKEQRVNLKIQQAQQDFIKLVYGE